MANPIVRPTAKIYTFPAHVRSIAAEPRGGAQPVADLKYLAVAEAAIGACWYHEAALRELDPKRKI